MKKLFWIFIFTLFVGLISNENANAQRHGYNHQRHVRHAAYNRGYHDGARAAYRYDRRHYPRHYYAHRGYYAPRRYYYPRHRRHYYAPAPRPRAVVHVRVPLPPPPPRVIVRP